MHILADSYRAVGRRDEALGLLEEVLPVSCKVNGPGAPATQFIIWEPGDFLLRRRPHGRGAQDARGGAGELDRKVLGPEHPDTLNAMANLANSYFDAGRKDEALKLREEVLALSRKVLGPEHPDTLGAMRNLAISYLDAGRKDEAIKLREEVLPLMP